MAHMTVNQRAQVDRIDLRVPTTGVRVRSRWAMPATTAVGAALVAALAYAGATVIEGWAQAIVLGMILLTVVGLIIAVNPERRG